MAGIQIQSLPTASTLTGSELAVVSQNNITKKTTIDDINAAPLAAANDAANDAATALSTAQAAQSTANTALSTANGKLSTVSVNGATMTGNGTSGSPLSAITPTTYQQLTKSAFLTLVAGNGLVAGKSYLVDAAYSSVVYGVDFPILVTAISNNNISDLSWAYLNTVTPSSGNMFMKCRTNVSFSFMQLYETNPLLQLNQAKCQSIAAGNYEFAIGCVVYLFIGGLNWKTIISQGADTIVTKNVLNIDPSSPYLGLLAELDINADTYTINPTASTAPKEYRGYLTISGGGVTFTSLQNDVGNIVWSNPLNGVLWGTLNGAFLSNKFWGIGGTLNGGNVPYFTDIQRFTDNIITVSIFKYDGTQSGTPFGTFPIHLIINN